MKIHKNRRLLTHTKNTGVSHRRGGEMRGGQEKRGDGGGEEKNKKKERRKERLGEMRRKVS